MPNKSGFDLNQNKNKSKKITSNDLTISFVLFYSYLVIKAAKRAQKKLIEISRKIEALTENTINLIYYDHVLPLVSYWSTVDREGRERRKEIFVSFNFSKTTLVHNFHNDDHRLFA